MQWQCTATILSSTPAGGVPDWIWGILILAVFTGALLMLSDFLGRWYIDETERGKELKRAQKLYPVPLDWQGTRLDDWWNPHKSLGVLRLKSRAKSPGRRFWWGGVGARMWWNDQGFMKKQRTSFFPSFVLWPRDFMIPWGFFEAPWRVPVPGWIGWIAPLRYWSLGFEVVLPIKGVDLVVTMLPEQYERICHFLNDAPSDAEELPLPPDAT